MQWQARQHILEVGMRIQAIELGRLHQTHHGSRTLACTQTACKQPVRTPQRNLWVILPMSGRKWRFSIAGMHSMGAVFDGNTASTEPPVTWFTSRSNPA